MQRFGKMESRRFTLINRIDTREGEATVGNAYDTIDITLTSPCNEYLGNHTFIQGKVGFAGVYIIFFFILAQKHGLRVLVRTAFSKPF